MSYGLFEPNDLSPLFPGEPIWFNIFHGEGEVRVATYVWTNPHTGQHLTCYNDLLECIDTYDYLSAVSYYQELVIDSICQRNLGLAEHLRKLYVPSHGE